MATFHVEHSCGPPERDDPASCRLRNGEVPLEAELRTESRLRCWPNRSSTPGPIRPRPGRACRPATRRNARRPSSWPRRTSARRPPRCGLREPGRSRVPMCARRVGERRSVWSAARRAKRRGRPSRSRAAGPEIRRRFRCRQPLRHEQLPRPMTDSSVWWASSRAERRPVRLTFRRQARARRDT